MCEEKEREKHCFEKKRVVLCERKVEPRARDCESFSSRDVDAIASYVQNFKATRTYNDFVKKKNQEERERERELALNCPRPKREMQVIASWMFDCARRGEVKLAGFF